MRYFTDLVLMKNDRLGMIEAGVAGCRVAIVPDSNVPAQKFDYIIVVENLCNEPGIFVAINAGSIGCCDAGTFLTAVLESIQSEKCEAAYVKVFAIDAKNSTFFSKLLHGQIIQA